MMAKETLRQYALTIILVIAIFLVLGGSLYYRVASAPEATPEPLEEKPLSLEVYRYMANQPMVYDGQCSLFIIDIIGVEMYDPLLKVEFAINNEVVHVFTPSILETDTGVLQLYVMTKPMHKGLHCITAKVYTHEGYVRGDAYQLEVS